MSFLNNNNFQSSDKKSKNAIFDYFQDSSKDALSMMADGITEDAKEFFDTSIAALLGQMPEEIVSTSITMNKQALNQLLFSSMITGYVTKSIEDKVLLEKLWSTNNRNKNEVSFDKIFKDVPKIDDIDSVM